MKSLSNLKSSSTSLKSAMKVSIKDWGFDRYRKGYAGATKEVAYSRPPRCKGGRAYGATGYFFAFFTCYEIRDYIRDLAILGPFYTFFTTVLKKRYMSIDVLPHPW